MHEKEFFFHKLASFVRDFTALGNIVVIVPLVLVIGGFSYFSLTIILWLLIIECIIGIVKYLYTKPRPEKKTYKNIFERIDAGSFPSAHAARSCFVYLALATQMVKEVQIVLWALILVVGATRVLLKKHYILDVLAGYILGLLVFFAWRSYL